MRDAERCLGRTERDGIRGADLDRHSGALLRERGAERDAIADANADCRRGVADVRLVQRRAERESLGRRGGEPVRDRDRQRHEHPALRDAHRDRLPRSLIAFPLARRPAPLDPAQLRDPRDEQGRRLDEVVEEVQVRPRDR